MNARERERERERDVEILIMISISLLAFFTKTYLYKIITDNNQARSVKPKLLYRPEKSYNIYQFLTLYKNPVI